MILHEGMPPYNKEANGKTRRRKALSEPRAERISGPSPKPRSLFPLGEKVFWGERKPPKKRVRPGPGGPSSGKKEGTAPPQGAKAKKKGEKRGPRPWKREGG